MEEQGDFLRDPSIVFMTALLSDVKKSVVQLPRFQRGGVWELPQRLELLDSVYRGIPIGAVLLWRTSTPLQTRTQIGPHRVSPHAPAAPHQYILDGGQRITALLSALYEPDGPPSEDDAPAEYPEIFFDLENRTFEVLRTSSEPPLQWLPLREVLPTVRLLRFQRRLMESKDAHADTWISRADELATRLRTYKVPVIALVSEDLELATTTFKRVNSTGTRMSEADMVSALMWRPDFDLQHAYESFRTSQLEPRGWGDLDVDWWLRCVKVVLGLDLYASPDRLRAALSERKDALDRTATSLARVADFLRTECSIAGPRLVPYAHQVPLLAMAFSDPASADPGVRRRLKAWVWLTTYSEHFAGISGNGVNRTQNGLTSLLKTGRLAWPKRAPFAYKPLGRRFDFRHARARALAGRLARDVAGEDGGQKLAFQLSNALQKLVPSGDGVDSPGNRFFAPDGLSRDDLLAALRDDAELRAKHHISEAAWDLLERGMHTEFIEARLGTLNAMEEAFVEEWRALLAPDEEG